MNIKEQLEQLNEMIEKAQTLIHELEKVQALKQEPDREEYLNIPKELFFSILGRGVIHTINNPCLNYNDYIQVYNYDQTEKEAQKRADYIKAVNCAAKIYKFVQKEKFNPINSNVDKYYWSYSNKNRAFNIIQTFITSSSAIYFSSEENAKLFRKLMEKEGQFETFMTGLNYLNDD